MAFTNLRKLKFSIFQRTISKSVSCLHEPTFDVIIVGGGHAGTEACAAAARMGAKTLLITHKKSTIGEMSCNPSFGGIGKGHLMREVDALDGLCCRICDLSGIHYKVLNKRKGPAVWGYRAQIDRSLYKKNLQRELFSLRNLEIIESSVEDLILDDNAETARCLGIISSENQSFYSNCVVLTTGTFLRGEIHLGLDVRPAGRVGDKPAVALAQTLERLNFKLGRLKTGTPPRIENSNVDFSSCTRMPPDKEPLPFSFMNDRVWIEPDEQKPTHLTATNSEVEQIVHDSLHLNHHIKEEVNAPRYCPSIESKVLRYPGRNHPVWLEPEGLDSDLIYPQGISCTMPPEHQQRLINAIPGLEKSQVVQPGYGVEYDYVNPQELNCCLETKKISNLFFAGQINGTTGYEEAAAQGVVAGINAAAKSLGRELLSIDRTEAYIGILIDDLTTRGTSEPYRMFTSRSEFRLFLRPDNADLRLTEKGYDVGCVSNERFSLMKDIKAKLEGGKELLTSDVRSFTKWAKIFRKDDIIRNGFKSAFEMLGLNDYQLTLKGLSQVEPVYIELAQNPTVASRLKIEALYHEHLAKEKAAFLNMRKEQSLVLPEDMDYYSKDISISNEVRQILSNVRPPTIAAASSIPGMTPAALTLLFNYAKQKKKRYTNTL